MMFILMILTPLQASEVDDTLIKANESLAQAQRSSLFQRSIASSNIAIAQYLKALVLMLKKEE